MNQSTPCSDTRKAATTERKVVSSGSEETSSAAHGFLMKVVRPGTHGVETLTSLTSSRGRH